MSNVLLPELVRIDLNPDGSVTLLLTHPEQEAGYVSFGPAHLKRYYSLRQLSITLGCDGEAETLGFMLADYEGVLWFIEARAIGAESKFNQIIEHLKRPKAKAAVLTYYPQQAA